MSQLTNEKAAERFSELVDAPIATHAVEPHLEQALRLAMEIGHPNCDCFYLDLDLDLDLATCVTSSHAGHHRRSPFRIGSETNVPCRYDRRFVSAAKLTFLADRVRLLSAWAKIIDTIVAKE